MRYIINNSFYHFKLLVILLIFINFIKCDIPQNQKNSIDTLIQIYNLGSINNSYCILLTQNFKCNQNNTGVIQINLYGDINKPTIPDGTFKEFVNLTSVSIKNSIISNNFFQDLSTTVSSLQLDTCDLPTFPLSVSPVRELYMNDVTFQGDITLTSIDSLTNFVLTYSSSDKMSNYQIINNGAKITNTANYKITINNFFEFPSYKSIKLGIFILGKYFNGNSFNNFSQYKVENCTITDVNGFYNQNITYNFGDTNTTTQKIAYLSLLNLKFSLLDNQVLNFTNSNIISLTINNCSDLVDDSINGIKMLPGNIQILGVTNSNLKKIPQSSFYKNMIILDFSNNLIDGILPDLNEPKKSSDVLDLDLSDNLITGSILNSYCYHYVKLNGNKLSGDLPKCFLCQLNDPLLRSTIDGNNFNNYISGSTGGFPLCDSLTITSKASFSYTTSSLVNGTMIGWQSITPQFVQSIKSTPVFSFSIRIPNKQFELTNSGNPTAIFDQLKKLNFKANLLFSIPNINVTLEFDVAKPTVKTVSVSPYLNLGYSFLIIGSGYTSQSSPYKMLVTFGNYNCILRQDPSGNNIECIVYQPQLPEKVFTITIFNNETGLTGTYDYKFERTYPYISAVYPSSSKGGLVTLYGSYGPDYKNVSVSMDELSCKINTINSSLITCDIGPGVGVHNISLFVNGVNWFATDLYRYQGYEIPCPTGSLSNTLPCGGNGVCNGGVCYCNTGFGGVNCLPLPNGGGLGGIISRNDSTSTNIMINGYSFGFSISEIREINFSGQMVRQYNLSSWNLSDDSTTEKWTYINNYGSAEISYTIELVLDQVKNFTFAGETLSLSPGSLKLSASINNWDYLGSLNTLQLLIKSSVKIEQQDSSNGECKGQQQQQQQSNGIKANSGDGISINYITIQKDNNIFSGRFVDKVESDGRPTFSKVTLSEQTNDSVTVTLSLPYCKICKIDPDFSVLISNNNNDSSSSNGVCGNSNNSKLKWMIPTIIILGLFGVVCISVISYFFIRKKLYFSKNSGVVFLKPTKSKV